MALFNVDVETRGLDDAFVVLSPRDAKRVIAKALSKTAKTGRTKASRVVGREFSIRATAVKSSLSSVDANRNDLRSEIRASGNRLPLLQAAKGIRQTKRGVSAKAYGERQRYRGAFISTMDAGNRGVFKRATSNGVRVGRLPVRQLWGPSVPQALSSEAVKEPLIQQLNDDATRNVNRNIDRELRRQAQKNK